MKIIRINNDGTMNDISIDTKLTKNIIKILIRIVFQKVMEI